MARKWTKWAAGLTGATVFAVSLGLIQSNSNDTKEISFADFDQTESVLAKDTIFTQTINKIKQSEFTALPYFVSYEYEKEGITKEEIESYLSAKEKVLVSLDWGVDVITQNQVSKPQPPQSNRKTRVSK